MELTDLDQYRYEPWGPLPAGYPTDRRRLWAPYDNVHGAILTGVKAARQQFLLAMFGLTDPELADAVEQNLANPDIHCQITLDKLQAANPTMKRLIDKYGWRDENSVAIGTSEHGAYMHRKVFVVDLRFLFTGSTNWSLDAETKQDNELTVVDSPVEAGAAAMVLALEHEKARTQMQSSKPTQ